MTRSIRSLRAVLVVGTALAVSLVAVPAASAASYYGTYRNDNITGSWGADLILGYGGHDVLTGSWGADTIAGHAGNDTLYGSPGNDLLNGGDGNDVLVGGPDAVVDVLHCGYGWDIAYTRRGDRTTGCEVVY
jgi:Ca2+-binding RTX toxin-like protein